MGRKGQPVMSDRPAGSLCSRSSWPLSGEVREDMVCVATGHPEFCVFPADGLWERDLWIAEAAEDETEFVWLLHATGTVMFPVGYNKDPRPIFSLLDDSVPHQAYRLSIHGHAATAVPMRDDDVHVLASPVAGVADLTEAARGAGYTGAKPVHVLDGVVVNHRNVRWEEFLARIRNAP